MNDLNCFTVESAMKMVAGTARSMGIRVTGTAPFSKKININAINKRIKRNGKNNKKT
jgi:ribosomal protein S10